jgi:GTP pyrophosphokinase
MKTRASRGPSRDWLNPSLGYVMTSHAREKIRQWFRKQERSVNIDRGRELLEKAMRQLGINLGEREKLAKTFHYDSLDDFYAALGYGGITPQQIALRLAAQQQPPKVIGVKMPTPPTSAITVRGVGDLLTHLAKCCHPVPGDRIVGYITRSRGVSVHRRDCYNVVNEDEIERLIPVEWGETGTLYPVKIQVQALDRVGLMRDITTLVAEEKVNIASVNLTNSTDQTISIYFSLETASLLQLSRVLAKIEGVRGVTSATRIGDGTPTKANP